jgi:hypothetical protein
LRPGGRRLYAPAQQRASVPRRTRKRFREIRSNPTCYCGQRASSSWRTRLPTSTRSEIDRTQDVGVALVYAAARAASGDNAALGDWLDAWRNRFYDASAGEQWALWRGRMYIANGDAANARALLPSLQPEVARILEVELLAAEVRGAGDTSDLAARFETLARESDDPQFLLRACQEHGRAGRWAPVVPHVDELLSRIPTPPALRLEIYALYNTRDSLVVLRCWTRLSRGLTKHWIRSTFDACGPMCDSALATFRALSAPHTSLRALYANPSRSGTSGTPPPGDRRTRLE